MRLRPKPAMATLVTTGMLAGMLGFAQIARAATTPPPFEPDPNARGCLTFYDANGNVKTSGSINDSPMVAYALGSAPSRPGDNFGTLYAAQPEPGQPSQAWLTDQMSAGNSYPSSDPAVPANLRNSPNPLYIGAAGDSGMATELINLPHPASDTGTGFDGAYQIRFITNGPSSGTDTLWWRADVQVTGTTWTQTFCAPAVAQSTSTTLTAAPPSPQTAGTSVTLTANVTPTAAVGSVQFQDNGANLGPAVSVTAGTATMSTNSLTVGTHSLTAVFTPTDPTAFQGSTSPPVSYVITAAAKSVDLGVTKTGPATATAGGPIAYTLTATNNGPSDATGVTVSDTLPAGVGFVSASSSQGTCTNASGTVTCDVGSLANTASATITINATAPATAGAISNTATISGIETDPDPANNSASASTDVSVPTTGRSADLSISKHAFPGSGGDEYPRLQVGNSFLYVLAVRNLGPSKATGVTVTDQLPAGVTFRKVATSRGTCTQASGTVSCALGTLKKGRTAWVTIKVTASAAGRITNTATVSGDQPDPHMGNNSSSVTITVAKSGPCPEHTGDCRSGGGQSALLIGLLSALRFH